MIMILQIFWSLEEMIMILKYIGPWEKGLS